MVKHRNVGNSGGAPNVIRGLHTGYSSGHGRNKGALHPADKNGFDGQLNAPWRKTVRRKVFSDALTRGPFEVSIFKQPVTLVRTTSKETKPGPQSELAAAASRGRQDKPKQVFWAKRLEGLRARAPGGGAEEAESLGLPSRIQAVGPSVDAAVAAASLASSLQLPTNATPGLPSPHVPPITGQTNPKKHLDMNPGVFTNPDQPLIHAVVVSDLDVTAQEQRVLLARKRLEEAMKHFG